MLTTLLILFLDLFALFYLVKALLPESKKSFFKREINRIQRQLWDHEFKVEKTLQIREGIRIDRDKLKDAQYKVEAGLKTSPKDEKLLKEQTGLKDTIDRYEKQIKMLDNQIYGVQAKDDNPGEEGVQDIIKSLAELLKMYKDYVNKL